MQKYYCINATPRFALVQLKMNSSISKETNLKKCDLIKPGLDCWVPIPENLCTCNFVFFTKNDGISLFQ